MDYLYITLFFIAGTIFGSFYNVVGFRLSTNESIIWPKSHCPKCKHELSFFELIPILSFIFLKGKCKKCKEKISLFYPLMEFFSGLLFAVSFYSFGFSWNMVTALLVSSLLIIVCVSDLNFYIIPDEVNITFAILIFITNILRYGFIGALKYLGNGLIIFLFIYLIMLLGNFLFKQESLGGGDVKLLFVLGMTLPLMLSFTSIALASFIALPVSFLLLIKYKDKIIPFGPFLILGYLFIIFFKIDINSVYTYFGL